MTNGDWTPLPAPVAEESAPKSATTIYKSTAALWGLVGMIGVGVTVGMFQLMIQQPAADLLELSKELQSLRTSHAQIKQEQLHLNEAVTKTLPARQNAVFERLNQVTGRLDQLGETITRVASRETRPDKFTGADGNRMESRLTAQHDADIARIEQADHDMQGKLAKLERVCAPPAKIQFNGPGR